MRPGYLAPEWLAFRKDTCYLCPQPGTNCSEPGVTITTLELAPGYWRSGNTSVAVLPCPDDTAARIRRAAAARRLAARGAA